jgi:hypothetical protein
MGTMATASLLAALLAGPAPTVLEVQTYWIPEGEAQFSFHAGGRELCSFRGRAPAGQNMGRGSCRLELPAGTRALEVKGRYTATRWDADARRTHVSSVAGEQEFALRDGSALSAPLRAPTGSARERWQLVAEAERRLVAGWDGTPLLAHDAPVATRAVDEAAARLGFALPPGYRELVTTVGALQFGDSHVPGPADLARADRTILHRWGHGDGGTPSWLSEGTSRLLARSVVLFFEVGDGMGGVLFVPPPNDTCGQGWASFRFHEESMASDMERLGAGGLGCAGFESRLEDAFGTFLFDAQAAALADETGEVLIDEGATTQRLYLRYGTHGEGFNLDLSREE